MEKFLVIGLGYVAKKHVEAIAANGHEVTGICDVHNVAGWVDRYFPKAKFIEPNKIKNEYDYISICTPNNTHASYLERLALHTEAGLICEKPVVLPSELSELSGMVKSSADVILQLRLHPIVEEIKQMDGLDIIYHTYRGDWYEKSWKGDVNLSGGAIVNIGIHIIDMIIYALGKPLHFGYSNSVRKAQVTMRYEKRTINIDIDTTKPTQRTINGMELHNFEHMHILSYEKILKGEGFKVKDALGALELINE